jgi:hypothetical protein
MKTITIPEESFYDTHNDLKSRGARIIRCIEVCKKGSRNFLLTYVL